MGGSAQSLREDLEPIDFSLLGGKTKPVLIGRRIEFAHEIAGYAYLLGLFGHVVIRVALKDKVLETVANVSGLRGAGGGLQPIFKVIQRGSPGIQVVTELEVCPSITGRKLNVQILLFQGFAVLGLQLRRLTAGQVTTVDGKLCIGSRLAYRGKYHIDSRTRRDG